MKKHLILQLFLFLFFVNLGLSDTNMGLVAHYPMDGNGEDISPSGNLATLSGVDVTQDRHGTANGALLFNGGDQMVASGAASPLLQDQFTLSAWIHTSSQKKQYILSKGNEPDFSYALYLNFYGEGVFTISVNRSLHTVRFPGYPLNGWFHIAATYDGREITIYKDGEQKASSAASGSINMDAADLYIGSLSMAYVDMFDGAIDDVRIYDRALSEVEVMALFADEETSGDTVDNCSADTLTQCDSEMNCLVHGGLWQENACTKPVAETPPGHCTKLTPQYCLDKTACSGAGGTWAFGFCIPDDTSLLCMQNNTAYCRTKKDCLKAGGIWDGSQCTENTTPAEQPDEIPPYFGKLLDFNTGSANATGGLGIRISDLTFAGDRYDATIRLNLDGTWQVVTSDEDSGDNGGIDLATAIIDVVGDNAFYVRGLDFFDTSYNFKVELNLDGSYSIEDFELIPPMKGRAVPGIAGSIYPYGNSSDGTRKNIEQAVTMDQFLFVSLMSYGSDQQIEVFDIGNPLEPQLLQTLDFGNITTDPQAVYNFPKMFLFSDTLIIQSGSTVKAYQMGPENRLEVVSELDNDIFSFASAGTSLGANLLSIDNGNGRTFVNFTDPISPFTLTDTALTSGSASATADVVGSYDGNAAVMAMEGSQARLTVYERHVREHLDAFWSEKIKLIFNPDILDRSLRSVVIDVAESIDTRGSMNVALDGYRQKLGFNEDYTIDTLISTHHEDADRVIDLLQRYGIDPNDPFKFAVEKLVYGSVNELFEASISETLFSPILFGWAEKTLGFDIRQESMSDLISVLKGFLDQDLELSGDTATYFVKKVVGPLMGNPAYMNYTMDQLIDSIAGSFEEDLIGDKLSLAITILTGGGLFSKLSIFTDFDEVLPCVLDDTAIGLLRMLMYEHVGLNPNGLAMIEVLKLYHYFNGNPDFERYMARVDTAIEMMHDTLAASLGKTLIPVIRAFDVEGEIKAGIDAFSRELPGRRIIARAIAEYLSDRFTMAGIDTLRPVRQILLDLDIFIDVADLPDVTYRLSDVGELREAIGTIEMQPLEEGFLYTAADQVRINEIIRGSVEYSDVMVAYAEKFLIDYVGKGWGFFDIDASMKTVIANYIASRIDLGGAVGANISQVYNGLFSSRWSANSIIETLPVFGTIYQTQRAADGDCLAAWRVVVDIAEYAAASISWLDEGATLSALITSEVALETAYNTSINFVVDTVIMEITSKILGQFIGNYSMMTSVIVPKDYQFDVATHSALNPVKVDGMVMEDRLGFVLREAFDYVTPRRLTLVTLNPENPAATAVETSLGEWMTVDYVHQIQGLVMIGGQITDEDGQLEAAAMFVDAACQVPELTLIKDSRIASATDISLTGGGTTLILSGPSGIYFAPIW